MKRTRLHLLPLLLTFSLAACGSVFALGKGTDTMQLLLIASGARAYTIGECLTAEDAEIEALSYNPASTAMASNVQFQASFIDWYDTFSYGHTAVSLPLGRSGSRSRAGNLFVSIRFLSLPAFDWIDINGITQALKLSQSDFCLSAGYNRNFSLRLPAFESRPALYHSHVSFGAALKFVSSRLADANTVTSVPLLDAGLVWRSGSPSHPLRLGLSARNLGLPVSYEGSKTHNDLPSDLNAGFLFPVFQNSSNLSAINLMGKFTWRFNGVMDASLGSEFVINGFLSFGAGYRFLSDTGKFMLGGSLRIPVNGIETRLNLGCLLSEALGNVFSVSVDFRGGSLLRQRAPAERPPTTTPEAGHGLPMDGHSEFPSSSAAVDASKTHTPPVPVSTPVPVPSSTPQALPVVRAAATQTAGPGPAPAQNDDAPRILLAQLEPVSVDPERASEVMKALEESFNADGKFHVVGAQEIERLPEVIRQNTTRCYAPECLRNLGRMLRADFAVSGKVEENGADFIVTLILVNTQSGLVVSESSETCNSPESRSKFLKSFAAAAARVLKP